MKCTNFILNCIICWLFSWSFIKGQSPVVAFSSYFGFSEKETPTAITTDLNGDIFVTGLTESPGFPNDATLNTTLPAAGSPQPFLAKFAGNGTGRIWSLLLPAIANGVATDDIGRPYITGYAFGSFASYIAGTQYDQTYAGGSGVIPGNCFIARLNSSGTLIERATYFGNANNGSGTGALRAQGHKIAVRGNSVFITGSTGGSIPILGATAGGSYDTPIGTSNTEGTGFLARFDTNLTTLIFSTRLGSHFSGASKVSVNSTFDLAIDNSNICYVTGFDQVSSSNQDGFLAAFASTGGNLWRVSHGTSTADERGVLVSTNNSGALYAVFTADGGSTNLTIPTAAYQSSYGSGGGAKISYIAQINPSLGTVDRATFFRATNSSGNTNTLIINSLQVLPDGKVVAFGNNAFLVPLVNVTAPWQSAYTGSFVSVFAPTLDTLHFSATVGGTGTNQILSGTRLGDTLYFVGKTTSISNYQPLVIPFQAANTGKEDLVIAKLRLCTLPAKAATPDGPKAICVSTPASSYTTAGATDAVTYNWTLIPATAGTVSGSGVAATVTWNGSYSGDAFLSVTGVNSCGIGMKSDSLKISVYQAVAAATQPAGPTTINVSSSPPATYTTHTVAGATSYNWTLTPAAAGTVIDTDTTDTLVIISWNTSFTGTSATLTVSGKSICGVGSTSSALTINFVTTPVLPGAPGTPSGPAVLCKDAPNTVYTTGGAYNATGYNWTLSPPAAGTLAPVATSVTVNWDANFVGTAVLSVTGTNSAGNGPTAVLNIQINTVPDTAAMPVSSTDTLCATGNTSTLTTRMQPDASGYDWILTPANAGTISSAGDTNAVVNWNSGFVGTAIVRVAAINSCGSGAVSPAKSFFLKDVPPPPATPVGPTIVNPTSPDATVSTNAVTGATGYIWTLIPGTAGTITGTGTTAIIDWNPIFTGTLAQVYVQATNSCGTGLASNSLFITVTTVPVVPSKADKPTGPAVICQVAGDSVYSTTGAYNALSYNWSLSPASAGVVTDTTATARVSWNSGFTGTAFLTVTGVNGAGTGPISDTLIIKVYNGTPTPPAPTGSSSACANVSFTATATAVPDASSYLWQLTPTNAGTISGTGLLGTVQWDSTFNGNASITVQAIGPCGTSAISLPLVVSVTALPISPVISGPNGVCNITPSGYTCTTVPTAIGYNWNLTPASAGVVSSSSNSCTINWSPSFTGVATLRVAGTNSCGTGISSTGLNITVSNQPSPPTTANPTEQLCVGITRALKANGLNVRWYDNPMLAAPALFEGNDYTPPIPTAPGTVSYWITQTVDGCQSPAVQLPVVITPAPVVGNYRITNVSKCGEADGEIAFDPQPGFLYSINGGISFSGSATFVQLGMGDYNLVVRNIDGCPSAPVRVTVGATVSGTVPAPVGDSVFSICKGQIVPTFSARGINLTWYDSALNAIATGPVYKPTETNLSTGIYRYFVTQTINGCQSPALPIILKVNVSPEKPTIRLVGGTTLVCSDTLGEWQWFTVLGDTIADATGPAYTPPSGGVFYVQVKRGGCSVRSDNYVYTKVPSGIDDNLKHLTIKLFPNPADDYVNAKIGGVQAGTPVNIQVFDNLGRSIIAHNFLSYSNDFEAIIDLKAVKAGVYFIAIKNGELSAQSAIVLIK